MYALRNEREAHRMRWAYAFAFGKLSRAHVVDGQKHAGGMFLGRGPEVCTLFQTSVRRLHCKRFFAALEASPMANASFSCGGF